jgi:hypothetical protein
VTPTPSLLAGGFATLVASLVAIYSVSQFLRNSIAVIANDLARELDLSATQVGLLSSAFFLAFAAAQIPVGFRYRIEGAAARFVPDRKPRAEEWQDRLTGQVGQLVDELREIDEPHVVSA